MQTNKSSVIDWLHIDAQTTDSYSKCTHDSYTQHSISNKVLSSRCKQKAGASNDATYESDNDSNDEIDQNVEVTSVSPNYRLTDEDEFKEKWPRLADHQDASLAVRNEYKKANSKPRPAKITKSANLKKSQTKASTDKYTKAGKSNTSDPYRASEPLPIMTETSAKDEKITQKNIVTFQNDQVLERVFMNVLIKHTVIALAIIIPLAVFSAYAAPVIPTAPISVDTTEVAK